MPSHDVMLELHTSVVANKDVKLEVRSDGSKLGTALISRGNIEWLPANNSVTRYRLTWEAFAVLMENHGKSIRKT